MLASIYTKDGLINPLDNPYVSEIEEFKDFKFSDNEDQVYFDPEYLDKVLNDTGKMESRLLRIIFRAVQCDRNYSGIVELSNNLLNKFSDGKFSTSTSQIAVNQLKVNQKGDSKGLMTKVQDSRRCYWINPKVIMKKSLIDKTLKALREKEVKVEEKVEVQSNG